MNLELMQLEDNLNEFIDMYETTMKAAGFADEKQLAILLSSLEIVKTSFISRKKIRGITKEIESQLGAE